MATLAMAWMALFAIRFFCLARDSKLAN